jgi:hypothetical protein
MNREMMRGISTDIDTNMDKNTEMDMDTNTETAWIWSYRVNFAMIISSEKFKRLKLLYLVGNVPAFVADFLPE